jgi:hypothetical protein
MSVHAKVTTGIDIVQSSVLDEGIVTYPAQSRSDAGRFPGRHKLGPGLQGVHRRAHDCGCDQRRSGLAGGLTDALNNTLTFAVVKAIEIRASEDNAGNIIVGAAPTASCFQGWFGDVSDTESIAPGGRVVKTNPAGWAVTATTADKLRINNPHTSATAMYEIRMIG